MLIITGGENEGELHHYSRENQHAHHHSIAIRPFIPMGSAEACEEP